MATIAKESLRSKLVLADDVSSLKDFLKIRRFEYVDVDARETHEALLRRWPLLGELHAPEDGVDERPGEPA